jgi:hypothetical protein
MAAQSNSPFWQWIALRDVNFERIDIAGELKES